MYLVLAAFLATAALAHFPLIVFADEGTHQQEHLDFFEKKVRPLLIKRCIECHGPKKQESSLRLDSIESIQTGGDSGPAAISGKPEESRVVEAVGYDGDFEMPPSGKLPDEEIAILKQWVAIGLPWTKKNDQPPGSPTAESHSQQDLSQHALSKKARAEHWALQPIQSLDLPAVKNESWGHGPMDRFILAKLEQAKLTPSPPADRRTLIRRASLDLIGLPPTYEEVQQFQEDESADAFAKVVDRLLASPHYGERWGRHWLDIARYADTRGYAFGGNDRRFPHAYTYRDYVIRAFNADLPFDQFVTEQLAADLLPENDDKRPLAALGFLTVGRRYINHDDTLDDRIDVVTRGLLGLTATCARCHDHKFDPIPAEDYYSLYGVFASTVEPGDLPLIGAPEDNEQYRAYLKKLGELKSERDKFLNSKHGELLHNIRTHVAGYLVEIVRNPKSDKSPQKAALSLSQGELKPEIVSRWRDYVSKRTDEDHPIFGPWRQLTKIPPEQFEEQSLKLISSWQAPSQDSGRPTANPLILDALARDKPKSMEEVAASYGRVLAMVYEQDRSGTKPDESKQVTDRQGAWDQIRLLIQDKNTPTAIPIAETSKHLERASKDKYNKLCLAVDQHEVNDPGAPPRAMVLRDADKPTNPVVFLRGNPRRRGSSVPRQFLSLLAGPEQKPYTDGSGRLELARAIVAPTNPLTARVLVNRVWMHHFGSPIVATPSDFGLRCDEPTHRELLDYLARDFIDNGWSIKRLHRTIMLSATYQQASTRRDKVELADPENLLFHRMKRQRLQLEPLRDSLLAVTGKLDETQFGRPVKLLEAPFSFRRTVYGYIDRQDLPNLYRVFDLASPDASTPMRPETTVPQQALFLMNSPFLHELTETLAAKPEFATQPGWKERIPLLYKIVLGRDPTVDELNLGIQFLDSQPDSAAPEADSKPEFTTWQRYVQTLLISNEMLFVD